MKTVETHWKKIRLDKRRSFFYSEKKPSNMFASFEKRKEKFFRSKSFRVKKVRMN